MPLPAATGQLRCPVDVSAGSTSSHAKLAAGKHFFQGALHAGVHPLLRWRRIRWRSPGVFYPHVGGTEMLRIPEAIETQDVPVVAGMDATAQRNSLYQCLREHVGHKTAHWRGGSCWLDDHDVLTLRFRTSPAS